MRQLSEAERTLDAYAIVLRSLVGQESELSRVLDEAQRGRYSRDVAGLLSLLDDCPSTTLLEAVQAARTALERQRRPEGK